MLATTTALAASIAAIGATHIVNVPGGDSRAAADSPQPAGATTRAAAAKLTGPPATTLRPTIATLTASSNPASAGTVVTYTVNISPVPDGGTVAFADSGNAISTACEYAPVNGATGHASCRVVYHTPTTHQTSAIYRGTNHFAPSQQTNVIDETVTATTTATTRSPSPRR